MDKFEEIAADIIDQVEAAIRAAHPSVDKIAQEFTVEEEKPNTLLYGEPYFNLETAIGNSLREKFGKKKLDIVAKVHEALKHRTFF